MKSRGVIPQRWNFLHPFSTLNSLSMQFVNVSTDIPIEKVARRVEDLADTEKTMELLRYIVNLYLLVESIFSIHVTSRATVRVANICSVFPAFF